MADMNEPVDELAAWSPWLPFAQAATSAPQLPGAYMAREGTAGLLVYVGMAGERRGAGLRGRLAVYASGKALASGLGEAVFDRAIADEAWLRARFEDVQAGRPARAKEWGRLAFERAALHVRWAVVGNRSAAVALERACLTAASEHALWNRHRYASDAPRKRGG